MSHILGVAGKEAAMKTLTLSCPYCESPKEVPWDGTYKPRYWTCEACGRRFIYEPLREGVSCIRQEDATTSSDPELREIEMGASAEQ
jgi:DNA-directed RNA polymerase subunit RPC12/RpoP